MEGLKIVESEVLCIGRCKNGKKCKIWFNLGFLKSVEDVKMIILNFVYWKV
jgi:hypothetical protein